MKFLLVIPLIAVCTHAFYDTDWKRNGFVQPLIVSALAEIDYSGCRHLRESIEVEKKNALDCLADIKSNSSFCHTFVGHFGRCTKDLVKKVESCISPKREGLPAALVESVVAQVQFICGTDGEHILEILNPCIYRTMEKDKTCYKTFDKKMREIRDDSDSKLVPGACRLFSDVKQCLTEPFRAQCQNEITRNTVQELFQAAMTSCKHMNEVR